MLLKAMRYSSMFAQLHLFKSEGQRILLCTPTSPSRVFIAAQNPANPVLLGWHYVNRGKSHYFVNAVYISSIFNKRILPLILDTFSSFFLFINYLNLFIIVRITFSFCNPNINGQNFCEDINSKIDYFLPLGMEEK